MSSVAICRLVPFLCKTSIDADYYIKPGARLGLVEEQWNVSDSQYTMVVRLATETKRTASSKVFTRLFLSMSFRHRGFWVNLNGLRNWPQRTGMWVNEILYISVFIVDQTRIP